MRTYENKGVNELNFTVPVTAFCPLGPNYYRAMVDVKIELGDKIVDFLDLEDYFKKELNGKPLTTEDLTIEIFNKLNDTYNPKHLRVASHSNSHFELEVVKEK
jgi:hypothetical protein